MLNPLGPGYLVRKRVARAVREEEEAIAELRVDTNARAKGSADERAEDEITKSSEKAREQKMREERITSNVICQAPGIA